MSPPQVRRYVDHRVGLRNVGYTAAYPHPWISPTYGRNLNPGAYYSVTPVGGLANHEYTSALLGLYIVQSSPEVPGSPG